MRAIGYHHFIPLPWGQVLARAAGIGSFCSGRRQVKAGPGPELPQKRQYLVRCDGPLANHHRDGDQPGYVLPALNLGWFLAH